MFNSIACSIPQETKRQHEVFSNKFIKKVLEEKRKAKELHEQEILITAENPRIRNQEETTDISVELRKVKLDQMSEQKRCQQLQENSQELRLLKIQLCTANVAKQLIEQKADLENRKNKIYQLKREENLEIQKEFARLRQLSEQQEIEQRQKKNKFRSILQRQIAEKYALQQEQNNKAKSEERKWLQELQRQEEATRILEVAESNKRKQRVKDEMQAFSLAQQLYKMKLQSDNIEENKKFLEMQSAQDAIQQNTVQMKQKDRERKQALSEKIGLQVLSVEYEKRHRQDQLVDLLIEERKAKEDQRFRQNVTKQLENRLNVHQEMEQYRMNTLLNEQEAQRQNNQLRGELMKDLTKYNDSVKHSLQNRRKKVQEYGRALQQIIESNRIQNALNAASVQRDYELQLKNEQETNLRMEQQRIRLLSNEDPEVLKYLPAGVLRPSECEQLRLPTSKANAQ